MFNDKILKSVAEAVKDVLQQEALKGQQHKIDKNKNNKIDAHDFKILRGEKKAEVKEANNPFDLKNYKSQLKTKPGEKAGFDSKKISTGTVYTRKPVKDEKPLKEEDTYDKDRYAVKDGKAVKDNPGHMGSANYKDQPHHVWASSAEEAMKKKSVKEGASQEDYTKEIENAKKKAAGEGNPDLTKGAVTAVKQESVEQIDEISKATLGSYVKKASHDVAAKGAATRQFANDSEAARKKEDYSEARKKMQMADKTFSKSWKRREGMAKAVDRMTKEEVEQVDERKMSEPEMKKREEIVKSMKKGMQGFKDRYGDRAKDVMYATATKQAMKD